MSGRYARGLLHLAAGIDQAGSFDAGSYLELALLAERGGLDFVTLDDARGGLGPDALGVLCRVAPATRRLGLVPAVTATRTESGRARAAVATLDWVSRGRAGWRIDVSAEVWDGWEPPQGRPVRVADATEDHGRTVAARYADVALVRAATAERAAAVRGELRRLAAESGRGPDALRVLVSLLIDLGDGEYAAEPVHGGGGLRPTARGPLYRGGPVDLADLLAGWHADGAADGFHLVPVEPRRDLERLVNGTVALLQHRGLFRTFYPGSTLRDHLGLARPAHRYAVTGGTS
ncbi:LLM class flavin-dependent oxidoreductase [Streptomyces sp. FXJ1.172]|uniref:LLM class flavin-dependent oxidoreductase n=1 Tax=Streptomyces sp. FXJ1.172 TaxID=710705 RepID=UPI0007CF3169|nr:LLM class flavin-dependent oxidoreductase [Streptomyces sp. FXJ1.172]WEO98316.1 LLM class flavin-dependent oxidoreductase [Streptomyces sp. FXJ1.172]